MIPCPFSSSPAEHKKHMDVWVKRWQCESQGEEGYLDADYRLKGGLYEGESTGCNSLGKSDLLAVGQCSPRALLEVMVGVTTLCLVVRCSVAGEHLGSPV